MVKTVYSAPALEKGLEILEYLVTSERRISLTDLAMVLQRSVSEIFRCVYVLEQRGFVTATSAGLAATGKAFDLSFNTLVTRNLIGIVAPELVNLSNATRQSSYLTLASGNNIVVIATQPSPWPVSVEIRKGARLPVDSAAGYAHFELASEAERQAWISYLSSTASAFDYTQFKRGAEKAAHLGWAEKPNHLFPHVTDLACAIRPSCVPTLALCIPMIRAKDLPDHKACKLSLLEASATIGRKLISDDSERVEGLAPADRQVS